MTHRRASLFVLALAPIMALVACDQVSRMVEGEGAGPAALTSVPLEARALAGVVRPASEMAELLQEEQVMIAPGEIVLGAQVERHGVPEPPREAIEIGPLMPRGGDDRGEFRTPSGLERGDEPAIRFRIDERTLGEGGFPAIRRDLTRQPFEVLTRLVADRQDVYGAFQGHGSDALQAPPELHPQIVGLGRELMDQHEPL